MLDVTLGPCPAEGVLRHLLALLGSVSVLLAPTTWAWKLAGLAALAMAWRWSAGPKGSVTAQRLRIYPDGTADLSLGGKAWPAELTGRAWLTRLVCAVEVREADRGARRWFRVCAANNTADDYRRLCGLLRLQAFDAGEGRLD